MFSNPIFKMAMGVVILALVFPSVVQQFGLEPNGSAPASVQPAPPLKAASAPKQDLQKLALQMTPTATLEAGRNGHFETRVQTRGGEFRALVDTGASAVALTAQDARAIGVAPRDDEYKIQISTANGIAYAAPVKIDSMRIGSVNVYDVQALVMKPGASEISLLGMSFLRKLKSFEIAQGRLVLRQ